MRVLIIPEDFRKDQFILKPIVSAMMENLNFKNAKVRVCHDPLLAGISQALNQNSICEILVRYKGMIDLFLLIVDRDGDPNRETRLRQLEEMSCPYLREDQRLLAENAWQEVEVWALAGYDMPSDWKWRDIRSEVNPKETYFEPFLKTINISTLGPGGGRMTVGEQAARRYDRIRQLCIEDVQALESRIEQSISSR